MTLDIESKVEQEASIESVEIVVVGAGMCGISCAAGLKHFGIENFMI